MHLDVLRRLVGQALRYGAVRRSQLTWEWENHGDCLTPVRMVHHARKDRKGNLRVNDWNPGDEPNLTLYMSARCRQCAPCLRLRGRLWYARARAETFRSSRTWFGTLTVRPEEHLQAQLRATQRLRKRAGVKWSALTDREQFAERHRELSDPLTRYLKRLRKERKTSFRYLLVAEAHKSGLPHYHALIHESLNKPPLTKATLDSQWQLGFAKWRLVEGPKVVGYVTKYIAKSAEARVRASVRYGQGLILPKEELDLSSSDITTNVGSVKGSMTPPRPLSMFGVELDETW